MGILSWRGTLLQLLTLLQLIVIFQNIFLLSLCGKDHNIIKSLDHSIQHNGVKLLNL